MNFTFHDYQPEFESLETAVLKGLTQTPKVLHPKFFYDEKGSQIFDQICDQPEYYIPNVERQIFEDNADDIIKSIGKQAVIIEPGAGSSIKIRFFLGRMRGDYAPAMYVPMDISLEHLKASAQKLADEYPQTRIDAICVDHTKPYHLPDDVPEQHRVFFYPGSSLGNFEPKEAIEFLRELHQESGEDGALLIGIDTKKDKAILDAAYNDTAGANAAFNLNLLDRIQQELDTDLNAEGFKHHAFYNEEKGRIEMHLVSEQEQTRHINGTSIAFQKDETIHTENSYKYTVEEFQALAYEAGWRQPKVWQDENGLFSVHFLKSSHL